MREQVTVVNTGSEPLMLEDGTQVGAANTPEARREGVTLSAGDRERYVDTPSPRLRIVEPQRQAEGESSDEAGAPARLAPASRSERPR
ncbi:MAG TPA: hypothetical protein VGV38_00950 [Pyrinomonadaceae bacterium]|nr:hypothetical protein [Pyrinomonadaceae bacterium]